MSHPDINHKSRPTSSFHHQNIINDDVSADQRVLSTALTTSVKRYATYELNWNHPGFADHVDHFNHSQNNDTPTNSAQVARWSLPSSPPPPTTPLPPIPQEQLQHNNNDDDQYKKSSRHYRKSISPLVINTRRSELLDKNESELQSPFGGITVTTVKVVEINSPTEKNSSINKDEFKGNKSRPEPLNLSVADPVGIITSEGNKDRKPRINLSPHPPPPSVSQPPPPLPQNRGNQDPKMLKQKKRSSIIKSQKIKNKNAKKPEMVIPKEMAFIDPRVLALNKSLSYRTPITTTTTINRNRRITKRGSFYRKKVPPKNLEFGPTSNPVHSNDPTDMDADLPPTKHQMFPWLPGSSKPPQLLHASLVPLPHRVNRVANNDSHITANNTIEDNNNASGLLTSINPKRNSKINTSRLSRVNSRRRSSVIAPNPNRASLVFRRQILEESLMMSFGGMMMSGSVKQQPASVSKPTIRRKTKKVSNAKIEDRETRRERRRKEKLEKKLAKEAQNDSLNNNVNNPIDIENKNSYKEGQKKELYMGPQPPPRKPLQDKPIAPPPQKPKNNNALSLISSLPDRRLGYSNGSSSLEAPIDERPPFPAHLTLFEHNLSKERSKRKQPPYSPPISQPAPSPISSISNYSRVTPPTSEGNEDSQHEIISSDEASSIHQLPSPTLTPNKSQKIGMGILGLFNKQTSKDYTSPPLSQISSPVLHPTQLSPQSLPITPITSTPPQSPPLSPRSLKIPQQLRIGKSRRGTENGPSSPTVVQDREKKRKMEQFEALIANSETSSSKKPFTGKIKALTAAITTVASNATSSASSITSNTSSEKKKRSSDGTPFNSPRNSNEQRNSLRNSLNRVSLTSSLADSLGPGDDGVIRVTLTPAVCR